MNKNKYIKKIFRNVLTKVYKKLIIAIVKRQYISKNLIWVGGRVAKGGRL